VEILMAMQALMLADNASFRNCLVAMRPQTKASELPSAHDIKVHIHNQFVLHLEDVKKQIQVRYDHLISPLFTNQLVVCSRKGISHCRWVDS
jgi:hypothetical protein